MSSSGILNIVSPDWLLARMGPLKRWSFDSLSNLLDVPLVHKLRVLWPALPTSPHDSVVKHRLLLSLLTLRTPYVDGMLAEARALLACALADASPSSVLVKVTATILLRLAPGFTPDEEARVAAGVAQPMAQLLAEARAAHADIVSRSAIAARAGLLSRLSPPLPHPVPIGGRRERLAQGHAQARTMGLGDMPLESRLLEPPSVLLSHYTHAPPGGPPLSAGATPTPPASAGSTRAGQRADSPVGPGRHYMLNATAHRGAQERASLFSKGVGALNRQLLLGGMDPPPPASVAVVTQELDTVLAAVTAYLRGGAGVGGASRVRAALGGGAGLASTGMLAGQGGATGMGMSTTGAGTGAGGVAWRAKRARDVARNVVGEEEIGAKRVGVSRVGPLGTDKAVSVPVPVDSSALGVSAQQPVPKPATLEDILVDAPLLVGAGRGTVERWARDGSGTGDEAAPVAGSAGAGAPPAGMHEPAGGPQLKHVFPIREAGTARVYLELDYGAKKWRLFAKKAKLLAMASTAVGGGDAVAAAI